MNSVTAKVYVFTTMVLSTILLSGCITKPADMYYWGGSYQNFVYKMHTEPGSAKPDVQIERLNEDIRIAQASGRKVPPGLYAHLGMMYAANGDSNSSVEAFNQEKRLFPESTKFIDGLLKRASKEGRS